jgi:hypothetical protein
VNIDPLALSTTMRRHEEAGHFGSGDPSGSCGGRVLGMLAPAKGDCGEGRSVGAGGGGNTVGRKKGDAQGGYSRRFLAGTYGISSTGQMVP